MTRRAASTLPRLAGYVGAVLGGITFMAIAGAPTLYILINLAALIVGLAIIFAANASELGDSDHARSVAIFVGLALLAATFFGPSADGIHRWLRIGPLDLHAGMLVLPALAVAAQRSGSWMRWVAVVVAALLFAFQPDAASALALLMISLALLFVRPSLGAVGAAICVAVACGWTVTRRDDLAPAPFVENILGDAMAYHWLTWVLLLSLLIGAIAPVGRGWRSVRERDWALSACLLGFVIASTLGNYPTPLVGYGASSIIGMALGHALAIGDRDARLTSR